jgi:hypothetical protein
VEILRSFVRSFVRSLLVLVLLIRGVMIVIAADD